MIYKKISNKQEQRAARDIGGQTQANSGALPLGGGADVRKLGELRIECKYTEKSAYTLKLNELQKVKEQALRGLEYPVLQFAFRDKLGRMDLYAVTPCPISHTHLNQLPNLEINSNSVRLHQSDLKRYILQGGLILVFKDKHQLNHWFILNTWEAFLTVLELGNG